MSNDRSHIANDGRQAIERRHSEPFTIGVLVNRQVYEASSIVRYEQAVLYGIRAAAHAYGCNVLLACGVGPDTVPYERRPAWPLNRNDTDWVPVGPWNTSGLIAVPPFSDAQADALARWQARGHPIVCTAPHASLPSVAAANDEGIAQALAHLVGHGHRRVAFLAADASAVGDGAERLAAFRTAAEAYDLPITPSLIAYGDHNYHVSYSAVRDLLNAGTEFTAVLASNDKSAAGALRALADAGRRVPDDVAVIGFDDARHAKAQAPPLTTVRLPTFELGYRAVELLLDYAAGGRAEPLTVRVPTRLIVRESCGCRLSGAPSIQPRAATPQPVLDRDALIRNVAGALSAETQRSTAALVDAWSAALVTSFVAALEHADEQLFDAQLDRLLDDVETANEDLFPWQAAISVLRAQLPELLTTHQFAASWNVAERIINQARVQISERQRRQHTRYRLQQATVTDQLGTLTTRLLTALELRHILEILADQLPQIGIRYAHITLFEAEGDDPAAWSNLYIREGEGPPSVRRFRSRDFPPPGLYDAGERYTLALLPLIVEGGPHGFVTFDAAYLEPCGLIVQHLAAAFRSIQLHATAEEGRRQAEEANRLKSRFLSTVSHELRTPLNLIVGLSDMLLRERGSMSTSTLIAGQDLERIFVNAQHLGRLIGDVLDLASSEAGQLRLYLEPLDLAEVLQPVVTTGKEMAREKGLAWHAHVPPSGPWVRGDRTRLRQVALNLLSNAVKFTDRGAIGLELSADTIQATVAIHDTGLGIPLNDQQRIFDEFRSSERTADRGYGGLGLGLAICKQLIERHGGTISVYSSGQEDGGATFRFSLPLLAAHILEPVDDQEPILARRRVVVLHEHAPIDDGLSALLDQRGFAVEMERVDADADWLPRLIAVPPAALILDAALATRRGWEIIGMLKRHPATTRLPVLMYALDGHNERGSLLELDYRLKPLDPEQLTQVLEFQRTWDDQPSGTTTILVVDDDPDTLALHTRLVEQHLPESRVIQARNGREALAVMEQIRPNLVLLDLMMPQLDGFGVLEAMRAHEATRDVPVVVLTAHMLTDTDVAHLNAGVASLLSKGLFTANEIVGHIEAALVRQRKLGSTMQGIVRRAVAYIHTHYAASITRDQLAAQVGVSADHLTASFRQDMGITPIAYLNRYRISRARTLLEESSRSVTDIALSSGFTDPAHFSRLFHREVGMSPNAYRRAKQH